VAYPDLPRPHPKVAGPKVDNSWKEEAVHLSEEAARQLRYREEGRNPALPNNFLDVSNAGFPTDIIVKAVQIPRPGFPQEMIQYRDIVNYQWLHVPWGWISGNGGLDGKAYVPNAHKTALGDGQFVAVIGSDYLMFANRRRYEDRRRENRENRNQVAQVKVTDHIEQLGKNHRRAVSMEQHSGVSLEEMLEIEKQAGDEPSVIGRID